MATNGMLAEINTKEGIEKSLVSMEGFYAMLERRRSAASSGEVILDPFLVLGVFYLMKDGAVCWLNPNEFLPKARASAPRVMTGEEFDAVMGAWQAALDGPRFVPVDRLGATVGPPPRGLTCQHCGRGWTIDDLAECQTRREQHKGCVSLEPFVGKTLAQVRDGRLLDVSMNGLFDLTCSVRNEARITDLDRQRGVYLTVDRMGWRHEHHGPEPRITWDYVIQGGDQTSGLVVRFYHGSCLEYVKDCEADLGAEQVRQQVEAGFREEGFDGVKVVRTHFSDAATQRLCKAFDADRGVQEKQDEGDLTFTSEDLRRERGTYCLSISTTLGGMSIYVLTGADRLPLIDLTEVGLTVGDFLPAETHDCPIRSSSLIGFTGELTFLIRLRELLLERRCAAAQAS